MTVEVFSCTSQQKVSKRQEDARVPGVGVTVVGTGVGVTVVGTADHIKYLNL